MPSVIALDAMGSDRAPKPEIEGAIQAARHHGVSAAEIPVRWAHSPATKVSMWRDSIQMFLDVFIIRWNALKGRYPRSESPMASAA